MGADGVPGPTLNTKGGAWQNAVYKISLCCDSEIIEDGPRVEYMGLWEDEPHPRAFSSAKHHRIKYYYDDNGPDDEAFVKGWTVPKDLFLDDLKLFVETMKEAGATVGYWQFRMATQCSL